MCSEASRVSQAMGDGQGAPSPLLRHRGAGGVGNTAVQLCTDTKVAAVRGVGAEPCPLRAAEHRVDWTPIHARSGAPSPAAGGWPRAVPSGGAETRLKAAVLPKGKSMTAPEPAWLCLRLSCYDRNRWRRSSPALASLFP